MSHTPGPWGIAVSEEWLHGGIAYEIFGASETKLEAEANARLIAAAPELLEALAKFVYINDFYDRSTPVYKEDLARAVTSARAAIARAEGK